MIHRTTHIPPAIPPPPPHAHVYTPSLGAVVDAEAGRTSLVMAFCRAIVAGVVDWPFLAQLIPRYLASKTVGDAVRATLAKLREVDPTSAYRAVLQARLSPCRPCSPLVHPCCAPVEMHSR